MKFFKYVLIMLALSAFLMSCGTKRYLMITDEELPRKAKDAPVDLFIGEVDRDYEKIAIVQSMSYEDKSEETKAKQLEQMKKTAREIGADAVQNVRLLENEVRGFVIDQMVPFRSWKQGEYKLYFLRGDAIIYTDNNAKSADEKAGEEKKEEPKSEDNK